MKKLLITTMAAVSVGLCAKAEDDTGVISETSFEGLTEGDAFNPTDTDTYWTIPTDTDDEFKITNVTYSADATKQHWTWTDGEKALSIDTANPILRNVNPIDGVSGKNEAQGVSPDPVFFDSVVQFTATDVAPSMANNTTDKLAVWLYTSPDDVSDTNRGLFGETSPITRVAVTAGYSSDGVNLITKNYLTNIEVKPDTWHRLTIKSFNDSDGDLLFNIWVDKTQVSGKETIEAQETTTDFLSRIPDSVGGTFNKLQGVAFDGKGAVDDIVFTTTVPDFAKEEEEDVQKTFNVSVTIPENATLFGVMYADMENNYKEVENKYPIEVGTESIVVVVEYDGTVTNEGATELEDGMWAIPVNVSSAGEGQDVQVVITGEPAAGDGNELTKPTVGGVAGSDLSDNAMSKILEVFPEGKYPAAGLTVKVNGETLTGAPAVAMLNDAVEMFTLAKDAKFFDAQGVLDISFKATGADPEVVAYEAKVGGLEATVNETSYEVVPKYIDIATNTELTAKPEGTVTFRLVIQKKTPTPAQ